MKKNIRFVQCIKETIGFTLNKTYTLNDSEGDIYIIDDITGGTAEPLKFPEYFQEIIQPKYRIGSKFVEKMDHGAIRFGIITGILIKTEGYYDYQLESTLGKVLEKNLREPTQDEIEYYF